MNAVVDSNGKRTFQKTLSHFHQRQVASPFEVLLFKSESQTLFGAIKTNHTRLLFQNGLLASRRKRYEKLTGASMYEKLSKGPL